MKISCCQIIEKNNCCNNSCFDDNHNKKFCCNKKCHNKSCCNDGCYCNNNCCGMIEVCARNVGANKNCTVKMSESEFHKILKEVDCEIKDDCYKIISSILIGVYIYIFIQSKHKSKDNVLCVIQGKINMENIVIHCTLNIQMCFNLYSAAKSAGLCKTSSKCIQVVKVIYSTFDDLFILLFNSQDHTLLGKLEYLEGIHYVGTTIDFIKTQGCELLVIASQPQCIEAVCKKKYEVTVFDECKKYNKCYIVCF
jgi:hypothetical protein